MEIQTAVSLLLNTIIVPAMIAMWVEIRRLNKVVTAQAKIIGKLEEKLDSALGGARNEGHWHDDQIRQRDMLVHTEIARDDTPIATRINLPREPLPPKS